MLKTHRSILWRADIERWRWLILGSLGALTGSCGGKAGEDDGVVFLPGIGGSGGAGASGGAGGSGYGGTTASGGVGGNDNFPMPPEPVSPITCEQPSTSLGGGWERCRNGLIHRAARDICPSVLPRPGNELATADAGSDAQGDAGRDNGVLPTCQQDSDCTERAQGMCVTSPDPSSNFCSYGCVRDSECDPGFACLCGPLVGSCVPSHCAVDGDCGNSLCASYTDSPGCGGIAFQCQFPLDQCASDEQCPGRTPYCSLQSFSDGAQRRTCLAETCVIGRPFLIDGEQRLAPSVARADWYPADLERASPAPEALDPELRSALLEGWTEQALMEHASVAAFARFGLQLISLGAPAELLSRAATAMLDEIRHARACFALARRYSDRDLGPGPLPVQGALQACDLASIVTDTVLEGCIGETVAAIEAAEVLAHCRDPLVSAVLERIVAEESQHAELAWQFLAWALRSGPTSLRERVRALFQAELERAAPVATTASARDQQLLRHGLMSSALRRALRTRVLRAVISPCAAALLDQSGAALTPSAPCATSRAPAHT